MMTSAVLCLAAFMGSAISAAEPTSRPASKTSIAPAPQGEELSTDYAVTVDGQTLPVQRCRVSAVPLNQVWPGYERPIDQTELASFAYWDMDGPVNVSVTAKQAPKKVAIHPSRLGIKPTLEGRRISFTLPRPAHFTVEVDGTHHALHLFASPPEQNPPKPGDPNVRYFGPGVHKAGTIKLEENQTVYIVAGAVVHGHIVAKNAKNIRVLGRGILDGSTLNRSDVFGLINFTDCRDASIDGIILRDPPTWTVVPITCQNVKIHNLKLIGLWRYNSDGIDILNSQDVTVTDCFVRSFDDSIVIKGARDQHSVRNLLISGCTIWNDWGNALEIGPETRAPEMANVVFRDCDIIRTATQAMAVVCGDQAKISDVLFENIRMEIDPRPLPPRLQTQPAERYDLAHAKTACPLLFTVVVHKTAYSQSTVLGSIRGVRFKNIQITGSCKPHRHVGQSPDVQQVSVEGLIFNGKPDS